MKSFDIVIIGGGHAGVEAANIACQFNNLKIAILTLPGVPLASAPCNPAIGGVGKGQVVRELDHLGGLMGKAADLAGIQYRTLNESKGFAVQSTRIQIDKEAYPKVVGNMLGKIKNLSIIREKVCSINKTDTFEINTSENRYYAKKLILTVGTFLKGKLHCGQETREGGRIDAQPVGDLGSIFQDVKLNKKRFKTGTPPRLDINSIDVSKMEAQPSDPNVETMHVLHGTSERFLPQRSCFLTYTNSDTMQVICSNKENSPMFNGQIEGTGARYCPSIEDKAYRYPDKDIHHVFVEPEGIDSKTVYPSGISSSLPQEIQLEMVKSIKGLEAACILTPGYAVEYDVVDTTMLNRCLALKSEPNLYFAGQVNGTSGYEEAAGQGYIAGVNAALSLLDREPLVLNRNDSYIGVMIEDLISNLRDEPYRLFTARSENRLYIREDNTALRMREYRKRLCLDLDIDKYLDRFQADYMFYMELLGRVSFEPDSEILAHWSITADTKIKIFDVLRLSQINPLLFLEFYFQQIQFVISPRLLRCLAISIKYSGYIQKAEIANAKVHKLDSRSIDWKNLVDSDNISFECKQRIQHIQPETFGQLRRIEGIRQATLSAVAGQYY